jgi:hypothetical protein
MDANKPLPACLKLALVAILVGCAPAASAAVTTVYKCFDRSLGVLYTDQPCRGEQLDIEAGRADANAIAELARERDALSRAVAQRIADNRRLAAAVPDYGAPPPPPQDAEIYYPSGCGSDPPYAGDPRTRGRGDNPRGADNNRERFARSVPAVPPNGLTNRIFR